MSLFKVVLLIFVLFLAYGIVVILIRRLTENAKQLAGLREQMARNDSKLSDQLRSVHLEQEKLQAKLEAEREKE
jgi:flagellar biosynthesis/type III secretory pathway M-ring protein FliF/YscJ